MSGKFNDIDIQDWKELQFSECVNKISIKHKIKQKHYLKNGKYPIIDQGQNFISGYSNDELTINIKKPVIVFGDHTRCFKFVDFDFIAGADGIKILEPKEFFNEKLFYYFCLILDFPNKGYSRHYQYLAKTIMRIPPLEIQKEIATRLDFSFDKIEKGIKYLKLAKENIIEYKQSMLKYAFEGKLTDCNNWEIKTFVEVCEILDNIRKPINATERKQRLKKSNLRYAYYGATGQIGYIDNFLFDFEAILLGEDGAPFLEPFKNKAYIVSGKYWVNNHAHILRSKDNISINKFLCYFLSTVDYMPYVSGTTRLKLNQFSMKQIKIPIPPIKTQKEIVSILDKSFESADNMLKYVEDSLDEAELLKRALLRDAFNGKI